MVSGIYTITCSANNKIYVGYASNLYKRLNGHKQKLTNNRHVNPYLQLAWNKYGKESFEFDILEECGIDLLCALEHYWCNMLNTHDRRYGYNLRQTNPNGRHSNLSLESIKKLRNRKHTDEQRRKIKEARAKQVFTKESIEKRKQTRKETVTKRGYHHSPESIDKMKANRNYKPTVETIRKLVKVVIQMTREEEVIREWSSQKEAANSLGINFRHISAVCNNNRKTAGGYKWKLKTQLNDNREYKNDRERV